MIPPIKINIPQRDNKVNKILFTNTGKTEKTTINIDINKIENKTANIQCSCIK